MLLVYEINNLRTELKRIRDKVVSYENSLGFNQAAHAAEAAEMRYKLQHAIEDRDEIDIQHDNVIEVWDLSFLRNCDHLVDWFFECIIISGQRSTYQCTARRN